jgi:hypothetical protein
VTIFKAGQSTDTTTLYKERKNYKENFKIEGYDFLDTWYESPFYGKLNENFEPVFLPEDEQIENLQDLAPLAPELKTSPFLAQAFNNFVTEYTLVVQNSNIGYPVFLDGLTPVVAHTSFREIYNDYIQYLSSLLVPVISRDKESHNFRTFMERVVQICLQGNEHRPLSKSGFLMSSFCPIGVSGLTIELTRLPKNLDTNKSRIFEDPAFKCFLDFSKEHGMIVDKNLPWRLYADLSSTKMRNYIRNTGSESTGVTRGYVDYMNRFYRAKPAFDDHHALFEAMTRLFVAYSGGSIGEVQRGAMEGFGRTPESKVEGFIGELLRIRMLELGLGLKNYNLEVQKMLDYHRAYSVRYEEQGKDKFLPVLGRIQKITSSRYKKTFENRSIDSYKKTTLKDYR